MAVKQQTQDSPHERKRTPDGVCNTARMDGSAESCAAAQNFFRRAEHHCDMHCRLGIVPSSRPFSGTGQARPPPVTKMHVKEFVSVCRLTPEPHPRNRHDDNLDQRIRGPGNRHQQRGAGCGLAWSWVPTPDYRRGSEMNLQGERGLLCRTSMKKSHGVRAPAAFIIKCNLMRNLETPYHCAVESLDKNKKQQPDGDVLLFVLIIRNCHTTLDTRPWGCAELMPAWAQPWGRTDEAGDEARGAADAQCSVRRAEQNRAEQCHDASAAVQQQVPQGRGWLAVDGLTCAWRRRATRMLGLRSARRPSLPLPNTQAAG